MTKPHLLGLSLAQLTDLLVGGGMPKFRAAQVWDWVHVKGVLAPEDMTNLSKGDRAVMAEVLDLRLPSVSVEQRAADGVIKWLFKMADGHEVESVYIPEETRSTLCVSSQIGCTLTCRFCHTGTQALARNLTAAEIVAQVWLARKALSDFNGKDAARKLSNVVFMGMGEPLYNTENVFPAIHILMDEKGQGFGSRKITLSTSGVVPEITRVGEELGVNLAVSLHAPDDETRTAIMPINKKYPVAALMSAVRGFKLKERRRITWEYVMLDGINDSDAHARKLVKLIEGIPSLVNMIPFNVWPGSPFGCSSPERIDAFAAILDKAGVHVTVRKTRGEDILAACGQLRSETSKRNTISLQYPSVVAVYGNEGQKTRVHISGDTD
ncbi:MAG: 23S rRNA (adenine(2503)-C(2))-methyltransferase RlmN [Proteobacteria bacterium]|nr:23S rRNA (adenine(2503)-C(2))-methyltransferase RlmN [Pseudomonadota bacterium]